MYGLYGNCNRPHQRTDYVEQTHCKTAMDNLVEVHLKDRLKLLEGFCHQWRNHYNKGLKV